MTARLPDLIVEAASALDRLIAADPDYPGASLAAAIDLAADRHDLDPYDLTSDTLASIQEMTR